MEELKNRYAFRIEQFGTIVARLGRKRNAITCCKLLCFGLIFYLGYKFAISWGGSAPAKSTILFLYGSVLLIPVYVLLSFWDSRTVAAMNRYTALMKCSSLELEYLSGNYTNLENGQEFINPSHSYSYDLDIFGDNSIYQEINRTVTRSGAVRLAEMLETNCKDPERIRQIQACTEELKEHLDFCHNFRAAGMIHGTNGFAQDVITRWMDKKPFFRHKYLLYGVYCVNTVMAALLFAAVFYRVPAGYCILLFILQLSLVIIRINGINQLNTDLGTFIKALSNYIYIIENLKDTSFSSGEMSRIKEKLFGEKDAVKAFGKLKKIQDSLDSRLNFLAMVLLNGLYMRDFHTVYRMDVWKKEYLAHIPAWMECITLLDVYISMANYRYNHPEFTMPKINNPVILMETSGAQKIYSATSLGHPLLHGNTVVTNDFHLSSLHDFYIITGANMAGKSTFLRAVGINLVLALSGNPVFAAEFSCVPIDLFTSMRTTDNLARGTSYFHAELLRLKELTCKAAGAPLFIILDEMLKGTNSVDKLHGSVKFLEKLLTLPVCGLVATHDLALGDMKQKYPANFNNLCFEIEHTAADIIYDYKLKAGVSKNMNASILLEKMGLL